MKFCHTLYDELHGEKKVNEIFDISEEKINDINKLYSKNIFTRFVKIHNYIKMYTKIDDKSGEFKKGLIKAELDIKENLWFFDCHFKGDPVMPGCLGLDAMWQLVGFYLKI